MTEERKQLVEAQNNGIAAMKDIANQLAVKGLTEARTAELHAAFDKANKEQEGYNQRLSQLVRIEELEAQQANTFIETQQRTAKVDVSVDDAKNRLDIFRRALHYGFTSLTKEDRAIAVKMAVETRGTSTQIEGTAGLGGYLVPTLLQNEIITLMKDFSGILQVARIRSTAKGGQITFPSRDSTARKAVKTAESGSIAVQDITYTQKVMDAYKYTDALKVSIELMDDSEFDILQEFRDAFSESFGRMANETLTIGDGSGDPNGVVPASTLGVTAASATAITLAEVIGMEHSVDPAYRKARTCGYMMHDQLLKAIKLLSLSATNEGAGTWQPSFRDGTPSTINGYPFWLNQDMESAITASKKVILFGDYSKYNVRQVKDMTIMRNDALFMATGEIGFFAHARWDGELFDTTAVKHLISAAS